MRFKIFRKDSCALLNVDSMGSATDPSVTRFGPGIRNQYLIHFVFSGKGYFNGNQVSAGQGFFITPGMDEQYYPDTLDPWSFVWIISKDPKMKEIFELFNADSNNIFNYNYVYKIDLMHTFIQTNHAKSYTAYEMLEILLSIITLHQKQQSKNIIASNADIYVESAKKYINSNISNAITVSDVTDFLGISQPYLYKIFMKKTKKSPKEYILSEKLSYAQSLLEDTNISIAYIANSVGFQDALVFSKFFRSKTGVSPSNYRKQLKSKATAKQA